METDPRARERFYDGFASEFDACMNPYDLSRRLGIVMAALAAHGPATGAAPRVLDGGAGTGWFSQALRARGYQVVALDIGPRLLLEARRKSDASLVAGSALALPFDQGRFDIVISSDVIEHTPDPQGAVREFARVLRPGGLLVLTCSNRAWRWSLTVAHALHLRRYQGLENWPRFAELSLWLREAGLSEEQHFGFHLFPFQLPLAPRLLPVLDRAFRALTPWMINQGIVARRESCGKAPQQTT